MNRSPLPLLSLALSSLLLGAPTFAQTPAAGKIRVSSAADLPVHTYAISGKASTLVENPAQVSALAAAVKSDILADLAKYDISDRSTLRGQYGTLLAIAMLQKDYPAARENVRIVRGLQDKPSEQASSGLATDALIDALQNPGTDFHQTLKANVEKAFGAVPYALVQDRVKAAKGQSEIISRSLIAGQLAASVDPMAASGKVSGDVAAGLLGSAYALEYVIPNKADFIAAYSAVLAANQTAQKPDIWAARDAVLTPSPMLRPVVVGIWDSGTDISLYKSQLISPKPGIAFDLHSNPTTGLLYPLPGGKANAEMLQGELKGFDDLQANIDSQEATALKLKLATLLPAQVQPFIEGIGQYGNYAHGTHVTGIALRGNPAARLLVCRITFDYHLIPEAPTVAQAERDAVMYRKAVAYFKANGVRVVNMSWGGSLKSVEADLEKTRSGGTPAERHALAKRIYDIDYNSFAAAVRSAPGILFVAAAGNEDQDVLFDSFYPSGVKAPNLLVVGAVDQAGEQTSFTSFGNVDVYADGFEVPSYVPGGAILKLSGTSMASPEVTNLAAKVFAEHPALTPVQVKAAIIKSAERRTAGAKTILLINPKQTLADLGAARSAGR